MNKNRVQFSIAYYVLSVALLASAVIARAQLPVRYVGTIAGIENNTLTVKTDKGEVHQVAVPAATSIMRISPGARNLKNAAAVHLSDLSTGDRVLVRLASGTSGSVPQAAQIIVVKLSDVARRQQEEREAWQKNGVGGLVKSIDAANGVIQIKSGLNGSSKIITIHVTKNTILKRYAKASVNYDAAKPAPISAIRVGDQLRARGTKSADGSELTAKVLVSGSFRNISGVISSVNDSTSTLTLKDLQTKKKVTVHINAGTQMRRLPNRMAQMLAAKLKGTSGREMRGNVPPGVPQGAQAGGNTQQLLERAPTIHLVDLKKGDAVMIVSDEGTSNVTAITLLAGVKPLLEAPEATNLLSNWSMNTSAGVSNAAQ